jgi:carbon storage regulator
MLVLSRKKDEAIVINDDITIVVVEIRGDKVRLGVEAPKEVPVHRREVFDAIRFDSGRDEAAHLGVETGESQRRSMEGQRLPIEGSPSEGSLPEADGSHSESGCLPPGGSLMGPAAAGEPLSAREEPPAL